MPQAQKLSQLQPDLILEAYALGYFPMALEIGEEAEARLQWVIPEIRGFWRAGGFHLPGRLRRTLKSGRFRFTTDQAFSQVIRACAGQEAGLTKRRSSSWIDAEIMEAFEMQHLRGHAHSFECWEEGELAGGLYGLHQGAVFFAESKFSFRRDASKAALAGLAATLFSQGFLLLDAQFPNDHLRQFALEEAPSRDFIPLLKKALKVPVAFPEPLGPGRVLDYFGNNPA